MCVKKLMFCLLVLLYVPTAFSQNAGMTLVCNTGGVITGYVTTPWGTNPSHLYPTACYYVHTGSWGYGGNGSTGNTGSPTMVAGLPPGSSVFIRTSTLQCEYGAGGGHSNLGTIRSFAEINAAEQFGRAVVANDEVSVMLEGDPNNVESVRFRVLSDLRFLVIRNGCSQNSGGGGGGGSGPIP
jgi:hypothetical protein